MGLRFLADEDEKIAAWVSDRLGIEVQPPFRAFGFINDQGEIQGGIVLNEYTGANLEATLYAPGCFSRHIIRQVFDYVFNQAKCLRLTAKTKRSNKTVCKLLPRLGFDFEATLKRYYGPSKGDDAIVFRLTHEFASRWI